MQSRLAPGFQCGNSINMFCDEELLGKRAPHGLAREMRKSAVRLLCDFRQYVSRGCGGSAPLSSAEAGSTFTFHRRKEDCGG